MLTTIAMHGGSSGWGAPTPAGVATPRHADADSLAHPERDPARDAIRRVAGQHAYTAS